VITQRLSLRGDEWVCAGRTPAGPCEGMIMYDETPGTHTDPRKMQDEGAAVMMPGAVLTHQDGCSEVAAMCGSGRA
jgi:hypothetical protein